MIWQAIGSMALAVSILAPFGAAAQNSPPPVAATKTELLKPAELDQLLAPVALYPDPLLAEVLMAATYPLEIVQAHRWSETNKNLKGDQLKAAVDKQPWDDSVKSLIPTPDVLDMMSIKLDWTQKLGDAVLAQQADVMDAIQRLRAKAQANNKLASTKQQTVEVKQVQSKQVITIEPTDPNTVYVPYYDPAVVYGAWPYADYPPYYFPPPAYIGAGIIATGLAFGAGYALGRWTAGGHYWGGNFNWNNNNINIDRPINGSGTNWKPRVEHRQGTVNPGGRQQGLNFRGNTGQQVLKPGTGRGDLGDRNRSGSRPNAATGNKRPNAATGNKRANAGTRQPGAGQHHKAAARPGRTANTVQARPRPGGVPQRGAVHRGGSIPQRGAVHRGGGVRQGGAAHRGGSPGGGRRSDIRLKRDITLLGRLDDGLGFYRFSYGGSDRLYVGVMAQEVQQVMPRAVVQGRDGYLRVYYGQLGLTFETYDNWLRSGARIPHGRALPAP